MKVVIDIPENIYQAIMDSQIVMTGQRSGKTLLGILVSGVYKGTPLPKGHGRLKDVDKIGLTNFECFLCNGDYKEALKMLIEKIENADTIVDANKEAKDADCN